MHKNPYILINGKKNSDMDLVVRFYVWMYADADIRGCECILCNYVTYPKSANQEL